MHNLITIGDPVVDTHVQISDTQASVQADEKEEHFLCFPFGQKISILDSFQALGGNAANVAVGASRLGLKTALLSTLGGDTTANLVFDHLKQDGVATDYITTDPKSLTRYSIVLNYKTERTILSHSDKRKYGWPTTVGGTDWIYFTSVGEGFEPLQKNVLAYLAKHPATSLAMNPGSYMLAHGMKALRELLTETDLLIVNLEEAEALANTTFEKEKSISALIHKLFALGPDEVVLTDGERGAWAGTSEAVWYLPAYPVKVVSKTGAGDAFSSGYLAARQYDHDIPHALEWGLANSSSVIQQHGAQTGLQTKENILKVIKKFSSVKPKLV